MERRVAELAAPGCTNRKVVATLVVSPKTVEADLARVYQRLAIASRAELGAASGRRVHHDVAGPPAAIRAVVV